MASSRDSAKWEVAKSFSVGIVGEKKKKIKKKKKRERERGGKKEGKEI